MATLNSWNPSEAAESIDVLLAAALDTPQYIVSGENVFVVTLEPKTKLSLEQLLSEPGPLEPGDIDNP